MITPTPTLLGGKGAENRGKEKTTLKGGINRTLMYAKYVTYFTGIMLETPFSGKHKVV